MTWRAALPILLLLISGCRKNPARVDLGIDLYLHPEAARIDDVILQAAIRKKIVEQLAPAAGQVHVRAIDGIVFLSGSVASEEDRKRAVEIARTIDVRVEGKPIQPSDVRSDRLLVTR